MHYSFAARLVFWSSCQPRRAAGRQVGIRVRRKFRVIRVLSVSGPIRIFHNGRGWHRQGSLALLGFFTLLVLAAIGVYLSLEAFDGDTDVGFEDAALRSCYPDGPASSGGTPHSPEPASPIACMRSACVGLVLEEPAGVARHMPWPDPRLGRLVASRSCARSRLTHASAAPRSQDTSLDCANAPLADCSPARGGFFSPRSGAQGRVLRCSGA